METPLDDTPGRRALDPQLVPFLEAATDGEAEHHLVGLLSGTAEPVARRIARSRLRSSGLDAADDVCAEVMVQILSRLKALRQSTPGAEIADFKSYVAVAAYNACHDHLRARYPERSRLKSRVRYLLTHQPGLATWEGDGGDLVAGFAAWREARVRAAPGAIDRLREDPRAMAGPSASHALPDLVAALLDRLGGPVAVDELVDAVARIQGIQDAPVVEAMDGAAMEAVTAAESSDTFAGLDARVALKRIWGEIAALPPRQRVALLLNLKDADERDAIALFPLTGTVTIREIAGVLDMAPERLAAMWADLPLEDSAIAALLGVTRQQVINLRKCARERLERRLRAAPSTLTVRR
jgi:RNA polymerase sigma factor (sigma-70 family)